MQQKRLSYLIQKWNTGQISSDEQKELAEFGDWASSNDTLFNSLSEIERETIRISMLTKIRPFLVKDTSGNSGVYFLGKATWPIRIAATLLFGILAFWIFYNPVVLNEVRTAYSQQRTLALPDGSQITLNGNSSVRYKEEWNANDNREVWIEGEVFFDVTHTQDHQRFIVHTASDVNVQVLGTRFNVKLRRGKTEVMLEQGKVRMSISKSGAQDTISLKPGELVKLENRAFIKSLVNSAKYSSWKEKKLYFDQTPLFEVAKILEDTHGYQVEFKNKSLRNRKLSGELQSGKVEDILVALRASLQIQITKEGNKLVFN